MENEILNIIVNLMKEDKIQHAIETRQNTIDYPIVIDNIPNIKVINDFNENYFKNYENTLIENATIYALENNKNDFLSIIKKHSNNLKRFIASDTLFKLKITEYAIKNITTKLDKTNNYIRFKSEDNNITINNNKDFFNKIKENYTNVYTITSYIRKLFFDFIERNRIFIPDDEAFLDELLFTNKLDRFFIFENQLLNDNNIKEYKNAFIRLILGDNYVSTELDLDNYDFDDYANNKNHSSNDFIEDIYLDQTKLINDYLKFCIEKNIYRLPNNEKLRFEMYFRFLNFNRSGYYRLFDIKTIAEDKDKRLILKKINPLYKFDLNE